GTGERCGVDAWNRYQANLRPDDDEYARDRQHSVSDLTRYSLSFAVLSWCGFGCFTAGARSWLGGVGDAVQIGRLRYSVASARHAGHAGESGCGALNRRGDDTVSGGVWACYRRCGGLLHWHGRQQISRQCDEFYSFVSQREWHSL